MSLWLRLFRVVFIYVSPNLRHDEGDECIIYIAENLSICPPMECRHEFRINGMSQWHVALPAESETTQGYRSAGNDLQKKRNNNRSSGSFVSSQCSRRGQEFQVDRGIQNRQGNSESTRGIPCGAYLVLDTLAVIRRQRRTTRRMQLKSLENYITQRQLLFSTWPQRSLRIFSPPSLFLLSKSLGPLAFSSSDARRDCGRD